MFRNCNAVSAGQPVSITRARNQLVAKRYVPHHDARRRVIDVGGHSELHHLAYVVHNAPRVDEVHVYLRI